MKILWPSDVPLALYNSRIFLTKFLLLTPSASKSGIAFINSSRKLLRKSYIVLSILAYSNNCCIVCTGLARYLVTIPVALELPPVIVSPVINFCCDVIKSLGVLLLDKSSTRTVAVALEVPPVIISPTINLPVLPALPPEAPDSITILLPSTSNA